MLDIYKYFIDKIYLLIIIKFENNEGDIITSRLFPNENTYFILEKLSINQILKSLFKEINKFLERYKPNHILEIKIHVECNIKNIYEQKNFK